MNCEEVRQCLANAFDADVPVPPKAVLHVDQCRGCARYQAELDALDGDLLRTAAPAVPGDLAARIKLAVAEERPGARRPAGVRWVVGTAACAAAIVTGWLYPLPWDVRLWWQEADAWRDPQAWHALATQLGQPFQDLWNAVAGLFEQSTGLLSPWLLWGGAGVAALVLVLFNAFEAHHLGMTTRREGSRHARG